jgi:hypothetical protein
MDEDLDSLVQRYALRRNVKLGEQLGFERWPEVQWEEDKAEIFGERWPEVARILAALQAFGVYLLDINPGNISFPEETR